MVVLSVRQKNFFEETMFGTGLLHKDLAVLFHYLCVNLCRAFRAKRKRLVGNLKRYRIDGGTGQGLSFERSFLSH